MLVNERLYSKRLPNQLAPVAAPSLRYTGCQSVQLSVAHPQRPFYGSVVRPQCLLSPRFSRRRFAVLLAIAVLFSVPQFPIVVAGVFAFITEGRLIASVVMAGCAWQGNLINPGEGLRRGGVHPWRIFRVIATSVMRSHGVRAIGRNSSLNSLRNWLNAPIVARPLFTQS